MCYVGGDKKLSVAKILNATLEICKQLTAECSTEDPDPSCIAFPRTFRETLDNHFPTKPPALGKNTVFISSRVHTSPWSGKPSQWLSQACTGGSG